MSRMPPRGALRWVAGAMRLEFKREVQARDINWKVMSI